MASPFLIECISSDAMRRYSAAVLGLREPSRRFGMGFDRETV
jgi:hypothetical protein